MGWRAVSAAGLQGKGLRKRNVLFPDTSGKAELLLLCVSRFLTRFTGISPDVH